MKAPVKAELRLRIEQLEAAIQKLLNAGEKMRTNLFDAAILYPEHWNQEGINQLLNEYWHNAQLEARDAIKRVEVGR